MPARRDEPLACHIQHITGQIFLKESMMSKRTIGIGLIVLGVIIAIVSLAADAIGLGKAPGLGWEQWTFACVGVIVALIGALVMK
jgi:hypothetical protein